MATPSRKRPSAPRKPKVPLHEMFRTVGDQLTDADVKLLKRVHEKYLPKETMDLIRDGFSFLLALEKHGRCDATSLRYVRQLMRVMRRYDLAQFLTLGKRSTVKDDDIYIFLEQNFTPKILEPTTESPEEPPPRENDDESGCDCSDFRPFTSYCLCGRPMSTRFGCGRCPYQGEPCASCDGINNDPDTNDPDGQRPEVPPLPRRSSRKRKYVNYSDKPAPPGDQYVNYYPAEKIPVKENPEHCDIRLSVRAEFIDYNALEQGIHSNRPTVTEQQFDRFRQANAIMKARDLGCINCDIKFRELTYLDAFWRDYMNGTLLGVLRDVFVKESLIQAVGVHSIRLHLYVDEKEYLAGRQALVKNLEDSS